jgi:hypothetical protein
MQAQRRVMYSGIYNGLISYIMDLVVYDVYIVL